MGLCSRWLLVSTLLQNHDGSAAAVHLFKTVKVKTGGQKYVIWLCFPKNHFKKNAFEVDDGDTLLFSQARLQKR
jgi:hypothetical protein